MNGWRRIWVALTGLGLLFAVISAWIKAFEYSPARYDMYSSLLLELDNPACAPYTTEPMANLVKPKFSEDGTTCYQIYVGRRYSKTGATPYTADVFNRDEQAENVQQFWRDAGILLVLTAVASALLYAAGAIVAWVRRGFRRD